MAEAEEVIADAARHATIYARELWRKHQRSATTELETSLSDVAERLDLLIAAIFGKSFPIRIAQPPAPTTFLTKVFRRNGAPRTVSAVPATDGIHIWLPARLTAQGAFEALEQFRVLALQQAMRAHRGSATHLHALKNELERCAYLILEAQAGDGHLIRLLPGMRVALLAMRDSCLRKRPPMASFAAHRCGIEALVREALRCDPTNIEPCEPQGSLVRARAIAAALSPQASQHAPSPMGPGLLFKDCWTGELRAPQPTATGLLQDSNSLDRPETPPRSVRLSRAPQVREAREGEDDAKPGAWMVQISKPHEQVEDPMGLQRPTDRDEDMASDEMADALSELPEARLVTSASRPKEVFLAQDPAASRAKHPIRGAAPGAEGALRYPEWDYRIQAYRENSVTVHVSAAHEGPQEWVDETLSEHRSMANVVRRQFEMLRAQRITLRKQLEGEDVDLDAYVDNHANSRAGLPMAQALYQTQRQARRDMAILLLVDTSGSTDGWISTNKRVIDVEREALLFVSMALQSMQEPFAVLAFSGEGPRGVVVHLVKPFLEEFGPTIARRIAKLEPEHYTRAGAAIRHATSMLMMQPARHRLLLMLSDGKPNDIDDYDGRYGVEDMRQAVTEAKLQGIKPFCLTVDRQAPNYLPAIFGAHQYAMLPRPERLPTILLEWMKRLMQS